MSINKRSGTSLLTFNTKREPDPERGKGIKHLELSLPSNIEDEIKKWENGERPEIDPREAAKMLWSLKTASHLDGRIDAWKNVPSVKLLLPGWQLITEMPQDSWPNSQNDLQKLIAEAGSPGMAPKSFIGRLKKLDGEMSAADFLNDLLLIFKYAAIGHQRPIHLAADLYRLSRTLLAEKKDAPSNTKEIIGWLTAPLIVPPVFTAPLGPSGPRVHTENSIGNKPPEPPRMANFTIDKESPKYREIIKRIERDLDEIDKIESDKATIRAIRDAAIDDPKAKTNIIEAVRDSSDTSLTDNGNRIIRRATPKSAHRTSRKVSRNIGGFPVLIDLAEIERRENKQREEKTYMLFNSLPEDLKSRIAALDDNMYVLEVTDELTIPYHPPAPAGPSYLKPAGRTDLLLVRQTTIGYRRAEIAHVENVLIGETRERDHTKRIFTRDELFESTEQETEETSDLQTTDSAELSNEVSEVVSETLSAEGSVEITSRGPTKVVAKAAGAFEKSSENTAMAATEYATEIVDQAVTRIYERTKRETKSIFEQEIVEENRHHFARDKEAGEHVSGVYQYLERISRAKIFSYGERDLYDILVPEPAALVWNLATPSMDPEDEIEPPDHDLFNSITLHSLTNINMRKDIIKAFKVVKFPSALPMTLNMEEGFNKDDSSGSTNNVYSKNIKVRIKEGYAVDKVTIAGYVENEQSNNKPKGSFTIGNKVEEWDTGKGGGEIEVSPIIFSPTLPGPELGIAITAENFNSISGIIHIDLTLTTERLQEWKLEAYSLVAARYEQMQQDYELAVIRAEAIQPEEEVNLPSGARRRLKKMVRNELQRAAIGIMRNTPVDYDLIDDLSIQWDPFPTTDIPELKKKETEIQFLQQAFEWEHLSWVLYPYFWGRRDDVPGWKNTVVQDHPDPDFAAFLNSGAARLQISVRPGFQDLVKHFMETGEVYEGNGLPKMGDPGYVPFIDEQINSLGGPGEEVQWPPVEPFEWDIVTPTPLVLARKVAEKQLPTWDADTGDEIV